MNNNTYALHTITRTDALAIASLWRQCTAEVAAHEAIFMPVLSDEMWAEKLCVALDNNERFGWLLKCDNAVAAYVLCQYQTGSPFFAPLLSVYVSDLDVAPTHRGQGLTYVLMQQVETFAREQSISRLELSVAIADPRPQQVWTKHGFTPYFMTLFKNI